MEGEGSAPTPQAAPQQPPEPKPEPQSRISIEEFARIELRAGEVLEAEKVAGSKKLVRMVVDLGDEKRQVVAGIGRKYSPEQLLKKKVILVANLQPARLMGVESNGMVLAAVAGDEPILAGFQEDVPNGTRLR